MILNFKKEKNRERGMALFISVVLVSVLLLIALAISDIAYKEQILSYSGRDSKVAFYAADSGIDCAMYHDLKLIDYFPTDPAEPDPSEPDPPPECNGGSSNVDSRISNGNVETTFSYELSGQTNACVIVNVTKIILAPGEIGTVIESRGYNNSCAGNTFPYHVTDSPRNLERAIRVSY